MPSARQRRALMHSRNAGLQRLRSLTKRVGVAAAVLTGVFAGLAAAGNSGKHRRTATQPRTPARPVTTTSTRVPAPPSLPPVGDDGGSSASPSPAPAPAQSPPQQAQAPPVAVSGGS